MVRIVCNAVAFLHGRYGLGIRNMGALYDEGNAVLPNHGLDVHRDYRRCRKTYIVAELNKALLGGGIQ